MVKVSNRICNENTPIKKGINLNDYDYLNLLLQTLKDLAKNMTVVITEASNELLFKEYKRILDAIINAERKTYELMFYMGWYTLYQCDNKYIMDIEKELQTKINELN